MDHTINFAIENRHIEELLEALELRLSLAGHHAHVEGRFGTTRVAGIEPVSKRYYELDPATLTLEQHPAP